MRILDSKNQGDKEIIEKAPKITDFLSEASTAAYNSLRVNLNTLEIPFVEQPYLVRGLDYYRYARVDIVKIVVMRFGLVKPTSFIIFGSNILLWLLLLSFDLIWYCISVCLINDTYNY